MSDEWCGGESSGEGAEQQAASRSSQRPRAFIPAVPPAPTHTHSRLTHVLVPGARDVAGPDHVVPHQRPGQPVGRHLGGGRLQHPVDQLALRVQPAKLPQGAHQLRALLPGDAVGLVRIVGGPHGARLGLQTPRRVPVGVGKRLAVSERVRQ